MTPRRVLELGRRSTPSARVWLAVAIALVIISAVLDARAGATGRALAQADLGTLSTAVGLIVIGCGAAVISARPRHPVGTVMIIFGLLWSVDGVLESWTAVGIAAEPPLFGTGFAFWFVARVGAFLLVGLPLVLLLYPDGRLLPGRGRVLSLVTVVAAAFLPIVLLVTPLQVLYADDGGPPPGVQLEPLVLPLSDQAAYALLVVARYVTFAALLGPLGLIIVRYRRADQAQRRQLRWLLWAGLICFVSVVIGLLLPGGVAGYVALVVAVAVTSASVAIGIVKPDLADVDTLVSGTLVYAGVGLVVVVVDLGLLALLARLLGDQLNQRQVTIVALVIAVAVYGPLRHALWKLVRRLLVGRRGERYEVVSGLAARLEESGSVTDQLPALASALTSAFRLPYAGVEVYQSGGQRVGAESGTRPTETQELPIAYQGQLVGRLVLPARGLRSLLSARDQQLLVDVVRQAAMAVRTSTLATELQDSRERLVLDREEDRRRIRRDLHDGLGPALGGVAMRLDAAGNAVESDPQRSQTLIKLARTEVAEALADVRRLVHGLRPPALDDLGLLAAVGQQAERMQTPELAIEVTAEGLPALPAAVEVAAYRIVSEALANVTRHSGAGRCWIRLSTVTDALVVEVVDDGRGIASAVPAGVGLLSIRERTAELGGRCEIICPDRGGTEVRAWLPYQEGNAG